MGAYLDRLIAQAEEINTGITTVVERAGTEARDVTEEEQAQVDRDLSRLAELEPTITHYREIEERQARVAGLRGAVAAIPRTASTQVVEPVFDVAREFPSVGHWAAAVHAAQLGDADARARLDQALEVMRETAHQTTVDNPGLIPRPILGPVINLIDGERPFINSISGPLPLPAGEFDRPYVSQHVAVGKQSREKTLTASRQMKIDKLPVEAATYAGHVNVSRQNIKWTSPGILQLIFDDFAVIYAQETEADAAAQFFASIGATGRVGAWTGPGFYAAITGAYAAALKNRTGRGRGRPDKIWVSADVFALMGSMFTPLGIPVFPGLTPGSNAGTPLGLRFEVVPDFPDLSLAVGPSTLAEWYEDLDGLMQVDEPNVLGQLVGYAGFGAFLNTAPGSFTLLELPEPPDVDASGVLVVPGQPVDPPNTGDGEGEGDGDGGDNAEAAKATKAAAAKSTK